MNIKKSTPVLPNFIRNLSIIFISAISLSAYANHHEEKKYEDVDTVEQAEAGTEEMQAITDKDAYQADALEKAQMSDEEIKTMLKEEKRKSEMKQLMDKGDNKVDEVTPE